jgi:hypothetical protein
MDRTGLRGGKDKEWIGRELRGGKDKEWIGRELRGGKVTPVRGILRVRLAYAKTLRAE